MDGRLCINGCRLMFMHRLVSEKMDGIRAYWYGFRLLSRHGKEIEAPKEFLHGFPSNIALDGELWMGRGTYEKLISSLNSEEGDWRNIKYCIFDLPHSKSIHEKRMEQLNQIHFPQQVTTDHTINLTLIPLLGSCCFSFNMQRK